MCQRCLSTPCSWTQACRPRERQESVALHTLSQEDVVGHVAPTRQSPPRAAQQLTTCQLCLIRQRRDTLLGVSQCNQPSPRRPRQLAFRRRLAAGRRRSRPCLAESGCLSIEISPISGIRTVPVSQSSCTHSLKSVSCGAELSPHQDHTNQGSSRINIPILVHAIVEIVELAPISGIRTVSISQFLVHALVEIRVLRSRAVSASRSQQFHGYKPHQHPIA